MELYNIKWFKIFRILRLFFYLIFFLYFIIKPTSSIIEKPAFCFYYEYFHFLCPTCGVTRAFSSFMHLKFSQAFMYNPIFTVAMGPIFIFLFLQDFYIIVHNLVKKGSKYSIMEYMVFK